MRARLHLLLCAADARLSRPVAGPRISRRSSSPSRTPRLLRAELAQRGYRCDPIALGTNTDPYQPIEREWKITRQILEVLAAHEHPFTIVTKSALVERDLDLIAPMAAKNMARVYLSITTLDRELARTLEPRAAAPAAAPAGDAHA